TVHRPWPHAALLGKIGWYGLGDIDVFAINAAHAFKLRAHRAPDARRRSLLGGLQDRHLARSRDGGALLLVRHRPHQLGDDRPRVDRERAHAMRLAARIEREGGSNRSSASTSTRAMPPSAARALSSVRAPTITVVPAPDSARVVSRPIPACPPVTMAMTPLRSRCPTASRAVVSSPKPE